MEDIKGTEAAAVASIAENGIRPFPIQQSDGLIIAWPKGQKVESIERFYVKPLRRRGCITVKDHDSFIAYLKRMQQPETIIFGDISETGGSFTAIIDFHPATTGTNPVHGWGEHVCKFIAQFTPEWLRWIGISGKPMTQTDMAVFLEDNLMDVKEPMAAAILDIVKSFEATSGVEFKSGIRLDNGDRQIHYAHTTQAKAGQQGDITIPDDVTIGIPVFINGPARDLKFRFRYTLLEGNLRLRLEAVRPNKLVELALTESRQAIETTLSTTVMIGQGSIPGAPAV